MRNKILKEAFKLISKKSIKDVSMREISQACNITKPSLYYYFKDKDEICCTIMRYIVEKQNKDLQKYFNSDMSLKNILFAVFQKAYKLQGRKYLTFFIHFVDYIVSNRKLEKKVVSVKDTNNKIFKSIFLREVDKKNISLKDAEIGYGLMRACLHDVVFMSEELNKDYPKDITAAILNAINYKEVEKNIWESEK